MVEVITMALQILAFLIIGYMFVVMLFYIVMFFISAFQLRSQYELNEKDIYEEMAESIDTKPISIIVPAFNEEVGIYSSVRSLLSIHYPEYEIIVVNDGSKDKTLQEMIERFQMKKVNRIVKQSIASKEVHAIYQSTLYDYVYLVDKSNGGKADALNAGINIARFPYICSLDGDSVLERDAFLKVMKPIIDSNEQVIATGGSIRIANDCIIERGELMEVRLSKRPIVIMQVIEYLRAFLLGRVGLSKHNLLLIVSGAFGVFQKEWVIKAGGYAPNTVGEDMELVVRLHRLIKEGNYNHRIEYIPDPVCWTEAPESIKILRRQRSRWQRGLFESLWLHRNMLFNRKYGNVGIVSMPFFLFVELLGAVVEFFGYLLVVIGIFTSFIYIELAILLFMMTFLYGSILSMTAVLLEEWSLRKYKNTTDIIRLFLYSLTEAFWYRPLTVLWRCEGLLQVFSKKKQWGEMTRKGISK
ncbi:glycosyltransferase [Alkalihalobacillus sp. LMS39]|uniref:glycosyltransferase family 2 protein n=1 Tax=Alkalihalobacillus sp. LMS39 TaxID=2924032 RepID=UPI001FB4DF2C|nr:glycosyltransferase [Alkalihalobacillus sp. LMS39]UOE93114.1 glycosyltransferase [Alkalihalobacillus sp. LMS39]